MHVLFECEHGTIKHINTTYHNAITKISNQFHNISNESKLNYVLGATDKDIIPTTSEWLTQINQLFKWYGHDGDINKISMYKYNYIYAYIDMFVICICMFLYSLLEAILCILMYTV